MVRDIDIENDASGLDYMTESDTKYETALERYASYQKTATQRQATEDRNNLDQTFQLEKTHREQTQIQEQAAAETVRKAEVERQFKSAEAQLSTCIKTFNAMTLNVKDTLKDVSSSDRRVEWTKVETEFSSLK